MPFFLFLPKNLKICRFYYITFRFSQLLLGAEIKYRNLIAQFNHRMDVEKIATELENDIAKKFGKKFEKLKIMTSKKEIVFAVAHFLYASFFQQSVEPQRQLPDRNERILRHPPAHPSLPIPRCSVVFWDKFYQVGITGGRHTILRKTRKKLESGDSMHWA